MDVVRRARVRALRAAVAAGTAAVFGAGLAACGTGATAAAHDSPQGPPKLSGTVTVFAAASLKESFTELGRRFEASHPGVAVRFNFGSSAALARSIVAGAPADVFAAANNGTMRTVTSAGAAEDTPRLFARNRLEIAVPPGNPARVAALADLAGPEVKVALCAGQVPCGEAARRALAAGGVKVTPVTLEQDVKGALTKVRLGEVDAALVYRTDVRSARGTVSGVDFPESAGAVNDYPIVSLAGAPNSAVGRAFVRLVVSSEGRRTLLGAGFLAP